MGLSGLERGALHLGEKHRPEHHSGQNRRALQMSKAGIHLELSDYSIGHPASKMNSKSMNSFDFNGNSSCITVHAGDANHQPASLPLVFAFVDAFEDGEPGLLGVGDGEGLLVRRIEGGRILRTGFLQAGQWVRGVVESGRSKVNLPPQTLQSPSHSSYS